MLGGSNSSQLDFEPLNILEYLPMSIRIIVPLVATVFLLLATRTPLRVT